MWYLLWFPTLLPAWRKAGLLWMLLGRLMILGRLSLLFRHMHVDLGRFSTSREVVCV